VSADEYTIDARVFARTLVEQRQMKLKGGLYHLTQIQMAYNSNRIEGSQLSAEQTLAIYETRSVDGHALVDDIVETANHFRLFDQMLDAMGKPFTADRIKEYHRILKTGTSDADKNWFVGGGWKSLANVVGDTPTTPPHEVGAAIDQLLARFPVGHALAFEDICDFHAAFERIHPFQDGNGRIGRIIMFGQCLASGIMPFIVSDDEKSFYYRGLREYADEPGFLRDTFRHFQDTYHTDFRQFVPLDGTTKDGT
jgi:Fic family protein